MNDSTDDTSELDSYGVWVKHSSSKNQQPDAADSLSELDTTDFGFPIEDETVKQEDNIFEDSDFSDMFENDEQFTTDNTETSNDDSTLTADELANIATGTEITEVEAESISEPDLSAFQSEEEIDLAAFETSNNAVDATSFEDQSIEISDFTDKSTDNSEEVSFGDEEEISLDDFMTDGFSDESVSAGNLGFAPEDIPSSSSAPAASEGTEEISLDDFFDAGDDLGFLDDTPAAPKEEEILDEKPLEMDISFDSSVSSIETEDNITPEVVEMEETTFSSESFESDEIDISSFDTGSASSSSDGLGEEIDLSDFGIDSNAEETAVTQDVQEAKTKDTVVDYDLFVGEDNNLASAPVVNEIKSDNTPSEQEKFTSVVENKVENKIDKVQVNTNGENENMDSTTASLLQQIVADLSSLKNEINNIKNDLATIKNQEPVAVEASVPVEPQIEITENSSDGGFFGDDDTDDTIALSGDELNNIMNTAEFSTIEEAPDTEEETIVEEVTEPEIEETSVELPVTEEAVIESPVEEVSFDDVVAEDITVDETPVESVVTDEVVIEDTFVNETVNEEVTEEEFNIFDDDTVEEISLDTALDTSVEETSEEIAMDDVLGPETEEVVPTVDEITEEITESDVSTDDLLGDFDENIEITDENTENNNIEYDFGEEVIEEPEINDIEVTETEDEEDDLPEEISIPSSDEILVDSSESDFINSVTETSEEEFESMENTSIEDKSEENIPEDLFVTEPMEELSNDFVEEEVIEEKPLFSESTVEENIEETPLFEEDTPVEEISEEVPVFDEEIAVEEITSEENTEDTPIFDEEIIEEDIVQENAQVAEDTPVEEALGFDVDVIEEDSLSTVDDIIDSSVETEVPIEEVIEDTPIEDSPAEETPAVEESADEIISDSNVDYLTPKATDDKEINGDLKQEIKSVLLYMDQLLENLPEDKIVEFAKSEEFTTYQKLFKDLGLA